MSRISNLIERIEKLAHKFGMSIEEVIDILEGKHPTHCVVVKDPVAEKGAAENPPTAAGAPAAVNGNSVVASNGSATDANSATTGTDAGNGASAGAAETPNPVPAIASVGAEAGAANTGEQA